MKRLGIYVFCDKDGIVDNYISYFLNDFIQYFQEILIVCTGTLTKEGRQILQKFTHHILVCESNDMKLWGYKKGLEYFGWDILKQFEEVILTNDILMGPVYPFGIMFSHMDKKDIDFWGIFKNHEEKDSGFPEYIPSCFMAFRNRMIQSKEFQKYWKRLSCSQTQEKASQQYEVTFTHYFEQLGFKWSTYTDTEDMKHRHYAPAIVFPMELIQEKNCPVFVKTVFCQDYKWVIENTIGNAALRLYCFLQNSSDYPTDMILKNLLRTQNLATLYHCFHWNYILSSTLLASEQIPAILKDKKIGVIIYSYYPDLAEQLITYIDNLPSEIDLYFFTNEKQKADNLKMLMEKHCRENIEYRLVQNQGRDLGSLLIGSRDIVSQYDYMGFIHDKKSAHLYPGTIGEGFFYKCLENMLSSTVYIYNVIQLFEENPRLGILSPSKPIHAGFQQDVGKEWGANFKMTLQLAKEFKLHVPIDEEHPPIAPLGDFFWFRPKALKILFNKEWNYADFPSEPVGPDGTLLHAIERFYPFAAQEAGYFSGYVTTVEYAELEYTNWNYSLGAANHTAYYCWSKLREVVDVFENSVIGKIAYPIWRFMQLLQRSRRRNE